MRSWLLAVVLAASSFASADPARLTIVIDDLGQNLARDRQVLALPAPVVLAIIPETQHAAELAAEAHRAGRTVLLHLPMDPAGGPYAWHPEMASAERLQRLDRALERVPEADGVNNHEGSRMTADRPAMAELMQVLQERHLLFLDSRTSAATVAAAEAQKIGLASASRDVFLDNEATPAAVAAQLAEGVRLARRQGSAVLIGHPHPATLAVLAQQLPGLKAQGVEIIDLPQMIALRANRAMASHGRDGRYR
nr:divergent polysaccharide deacetylase family protein [Pseudomonas sp. EpS/L25]